MNQRLGRITILALVGFLCLFAAFTALAGSDLRVEGSIGRCQHQLAPDASWHYEYGMYQSSMQLKPKCWQGSVAWLPWRVRNLKLGMRASYVDLGTVTADNTYPDDEPAYFRAKESGTPVDSTTSRYQGHGRSRGFTLGLAAEKPWQSVTFGVEAGVAVLRNEWHVGFENAVGLPDCRKDWACADGTNATLYSGINARWHWLFVSVRRYENVHASNAKSNPLYVGPTTGPVVATQIGLSVPL